MPGALQEEALEEAGETLQAAEEPLGAGDGREARVLVVGEGAGQEAAAGIAAVGPEVGGGRQWLWFLLLTLC